MKIATITCHDVYNVGASLQAYALQTYLESQGHDVVIINYKPEYLSRHYKLFGISNPRYDRPFLREIYIFFKFPKRLRARLGKRKKEFDLFTKNYLCLTQERYGSNDELKHAPPKVDAYIAGSDQIWNVTFPNGKDPAFYLDFAPEKSRRISYAASFSTESIPEEWKDQIRVWLSYFSGISVRESSGVKILEDLGIKDAQQVLDPVFLLGAEHWKSIEKDLNLTEPYLLIYDFDHNREIEEMTNMLAKKKGWRVYSIFSTPIAERSFNQEGPLGFIYLVRNAELIVSNSFHATALSVLFRKNFVTFDRREKLNTRMIDLLGQLGLEDRRIQNYNELLSLGTIDYDEVTDRLSFAIQQSKDYLEKVLAVNQSNR